MILITPQLFFYYSCQDKPNLTGKALKIENSNSGLFIIANILYCIFRIVDCNKQGSQTSSHFALMLLRPINIFEQLKCPKQCFLLTKRLTNSVPVCVKANFNLSKLIHRSNSTQQTIHHCTSSIQTLVMDDSSSCDKLYTLLLLPSPLREPRSHFRASAMQRCIQVQAEQDNRSVPGGSWLALRAVSGFSAPLHSGQLHTEPNSRITNGERDGAQIHTKGQREL